MDAAEDVGRHDSGNAASRPLSPHAFRTQAVLFRTTPGTDYERWKRTLTAYRPSSLYANQKAFGTGGERRPLKAAFVEKRIHARIIDNLLREDYLIP